MEMNVDTQISLDGFRDAFHNQPYTMPTQPPETPGGPLPLQAAQSLYANGFAKGIAARGATTRAGGVPTFDLNEEIHFFRSTESHCQEKQSLLSIISHLVLRVENLESKLNCLSAPPFNVATLEKQQLIEMLHFRNENVASMFHNGILRPLPPKVQTGQGRSARVDPGAQSPEAVSRDS